MNNLRVINLIVFESPLTLQFPNMENPRHWRNNKQRYLLVGDIDSNGNVSFPPGSNRPRFNPNTGSAIENNLIKGEEIKTAKSYLVFEKAVMEDIK